MILSSTRAHKTEIDQDVKEEFGIGGAIIVLTLCERLAQLFLLYCGMIF